jgi:hypothetical protein
MIGSIEEARMAIVVEILVRHPQRNAEAPSAERLGFG